ncbi:MAG: hypothetical protein KAI24_18840 [Planctomycetes bacterium]|nr:hypothetical protein [Planctomycetota bacterium]
MQGEVLFKGWAGGSGSVNADKWCYTPWMPVRGDLATYAVEVLGINGVSLKWNVETRTRESANVDDVFAVDVTASGEGLSVAEADEVSIKAKELVRYKFYTGGGASTTEYVHFRALQPSWQTDR